MPKATFVQNTFTAGELSPKLALRNDIKKYFQGVKTLENFTLFPQGGVTRRAGTRFVKEVKDSTKKTRVVSFIFSTTQAYILEFGNLYIRVFKDGGRIETSGTPVEIVSPYLEADLFDLDIKTQSADTLYITHQNYEPRKLTRSSHTSWTLSTILFNSPPTYEADTDISGILPAATLSPAAGSGSGIVFTANAAVFASGDVGTYLWYPYLDGNDIRQEALAKIVGFTSTTVVTADITQSFPNSVVSPSPAIASQKWRHRKTTLTPGAVSGDNITFTASQSVFLAGDVERYIKYGQSLAKIKTVSSGTAVVANIIRNFPNTTAIPAGDWVLQGSPGVALDPVPVIVIIENRPDVREPVGRFNDMYTQTDVAGVWSAIATYRDPDDIGKYIKVWGGVMKATQYITSNRMRCQLKSQLNAPSADPISSGVGGWTLETTAWNTTLGYPAASSFFEGRLWFAGNKAFPYRIWGSKTNDFENMVVGYLDDDAVEYNILSNQVNNILWLFPTDSLFMGTVAGEFRAFGGNDNPLTPDNVLVKNISTMGSKKIKPVQVANSILFAQRSGRRLLETSYNFDADSYLPNDLTLLVDHFFKDYTIVDMAYQQEPDSIVWVVRSDGVLLGLTLNKASDVIGWHRHITDGTVESIAVIPHPDGSKEQVWVIVRRLINGVYRRYIEYFDNDGVNYSQLNTDASLTCGKDIFYGDGSTTAFVSNCDIQNPAEVIVSVDDVVITSIVLSSPGNIASNGDHSINLKTDGTLWAWGQGGNGQLGDGAAVNRLSPVQIGEDTNWAKISSGWKHTLAIKTDGTLWAWGYNFQGQLGDDTNTQRNTPVQIGTDTHWAFVSAGEEHSAAIKTDGTLWAWGWNGNGQLGDGTNTNRNTPVQIGTDTTWTYITTGTRHTVGIKYNKSLWAWGLNNNGQLGDGTIVDKNVPTLIDSGTWNMADAGALFTLAIKTDDTLWAWGLNSNGQLGNNTTTSSLVPIQIGTNWAKISSGFRHALAIKTNGQLWGWGYNFQGQLGDGTTTQRNAPVQIGTATNWDAVIAGQDHTRIRNTTGELYATGYNAYGQLGDGTTVNKNVPTLISTAIIWIVSKDISLIITTTYTVNTATDTVTFVTAPANRAKIEFFSTRKISTVNTNIVFSSRIIGENTRKVTAGGAHSIALKTNGTLWSWGGNNAGQLGLGTTVDKRVPTKIGTDVDWAKISAGNYFSLAIKTNGQLWAWGANDYGQLGDGTTTQRNAPVRIGTDTDWSTVSCGGLHTLAIKTNGQLWAWGWNIYGALGDGTSNNQRVLPFQIGTETDWSQISCGNYHSFAMKTNGTLWATGLNTAGQLGLGDTTQRTSFTQVTGTDWLQISAGNYFSLALKTNSTLWTWGDNAYGQLGLNDTTQRTSPTAVVTDNNNWVQVSGGAYHGLAIQATGALWAWGYNNSGQLGLGDTTNRWIPTRVGTDLSWVQIARGCGGPHSLALKMTGTLWAWGYNFSGQLGDDTSGAGADKWSPVQITTATDFVSFSFLSPLEGKTVAIVGDGAVYPSKVVTNGIITLDGIPAALIELGLPYYSLLTTLRPDIPQGSIYNRPKKWNQITIALLETLGLSIVVPNADYDIPFRNGSDKMDKPVPLFTGDKEIDGSMAWSKDAPITLQQLLPLPCTILGFTGYLDIGDI